MSNSKTVLILGGTGFVGRAVVEKYLKNNWRVIIPTRDEDINEAKEKLILHGFEKYSLEKLIADNLLLFTFNIDLVNKKWSQTESWLKLLSELNIAPSLILRIINLVGETSRSANEIFKSNIDVLNSVFTIVQFLKSRNKDVIFCNMGTTAEKKQGRNLPPYEYAKRIIREKIEESGLCDFHFIAHYIKGKGEQKMKLAASILWDKLKFSHKWLFGFKVSIIDVDDLAEIIYSLPEIIKTSAQKPIEVNVTNGELIFGEMVRNLLPEDKRVISKAIIPSRLERYFLRFYAFIIPLIKSKDQLARRLANFAKRSSMNPIQRDKLRFFKTAEEIKKLVRDTANYEVLETTPDLIIGDKHRLIIYVLRERSKEELKQIVQKALIPFD